MKRMDERCEIAHLERAAVFDLGLPEPRYWFSVSLQFSEEDKQVNR